jgi:hypothetical protein
MPSIKWSSFAIGAVFALFVLPMILSFVKGGATRSQRSA